MLTLYFGDIRNLSIIVLLVAAALAYGSSVVLAVPYQQNMVVREVATVGPINARKLSDAPVEARENVVSDFVKIETEDIFERELKGRGGGKRGKRGKGRRVMHWRRWRGNATGRGWKF